MNCKAIGTRRVIAAALLALSGTAAAVEPASPLLADYLTECEAAGQRLWGRSLCSPVVVVDTRDGSIIASESMPGPLPATRANTAIDWAGRRWVMVLGPLPHDPAERANLLFHEAFHVHQPTLGLAASDAVAGHLSELRPRILLLLEWRALEQALGSDGSVRDGHIRQALAFRSERLGSADAARNERAQMLNEGVASYTGVALSGEPVRLALAALRRAAGGPSLGRTFAYASGPAWGLLLDAIRPDWKQSLDSGRDLPDLMPRQPADVADGSLYDEAALVEQERAVAAEQRQRLDDALARTSGADTLQLPLRSPAMDFDPNQVTATGDGTRIYWKIVLRDAWGELRVDGSPLRVSGGFDAVSIPWPLATDASLNLADGWYLDDAQQPRRVQDRRRRAAE